ncbi:MAG: MobF family relaxase [Ilumatobacteraceae bacterium]|nr:MobF family relaxase [Ilumatobacteraceae bacterium]
MTVRVTTLKGIDAGGYYVDRLPNYYLDSSEPSGVWLGRGASMLGLRGEVGDEAFLDLMAGLDPNDPGRDLGRSYGDSSVRGFDVTCSAPKSVSVLFALGDDRVRYEAIDAHDSSVAALAGWIESHAHTRYRIGGEVAVVDAEGIVVAAFRQHTSRALDPQLHTHVVIPNRVKSPDGRWLALDARLIKRDQRTLSALYHAALRSELTARLGVRWHGPENGIAEIGDMNDIVLEQFSSRTASIRQRTDEKLERFVANMDRDPTPRERWKLEREAVLDSRPGKGVAIDAESLHDEWFASACELGYSPDDIVDGAIDQLNGRSRLDPEEVRDVCELSIAALTDRQSSWRPTEVHRELTAALPTDLAVPAGQLVSDLDRVAVQIVDTRCVDISKPVAPGSLLRKDGRPVSESAVDRAFTTQAILDQEHDLLAWAATRSNNDIGRVGLVDESDIDLNVAQAEAAGRVAGRDDLVLIVGPAGTGKTTALRPAVSALRRAGRPVFGIAPSAVAAEVLEHETGVAADTIDKLLIEHRLDRPPDHRYDLPAGTTLIVDEAGMVPTPKLDELARLADRRHWRVALVGDPLQFSAVGRGGMFELLIESCGAVELERVHRFDNEWERDASLRLRRSDVDVADLYDKHGRLHGGSPQRMRQMAVDRWWDERQAGQTPLLMTPTNEIVDHLNQLCQRRRILAREIDATSRGVSVGTNAIFVGDEVATRQNDRRLLTDRGEMVRNRAEWTVVAVHRDRSITVEGRNGTARLPYEYVTEHVDLAYARTGAGAQGRTVDAGILYLDSPTDVRNLYVPMTRGRKSNEAFVATSGEITALDVITQSIATDWIDRPALARQAELSGDASTHGFGDEPALGLQPQISEAPPSGERPGEDADPSVPAEPELPDRFAASRRILDQWSRMRQTADGPRPPDIPLPGR